jgi:hypothetical protein
LQAESDAAFGPDQLRVIGRPTSMSRERMKASRLLLLAPNRVDQLIARDDPPDETLAGSGRRDIRVRARRRACNTSKENGVVR